MDHTFKDIKDAVFFVEKDGKPMKVAEVKDVEFNFNSKHSVEILPKTSFSFEFELPDKSEGINGHGVHSTTSMEYSFSPKK
ncbi:hypothetical protein [Bacillus cereus]|uniref:hypothetical protein n=1 Tax=Bacillus cereus TaxID=1396 RepID=UPI0020CC548E|nr:hypothetical protein [Bacillus cereus]